VEHGWRWIIHHLGSLPDSHSPTVESDADTDCFGTAGQPGASLKRRALSWIERYAPRIRTRRLMAHLGFRRDNCENDATGEIVRWMILYLTPRRILNRR
jgi:hypothetical protein